jgi:uncharacterized Zn finger protein (UPF0148 family)
MTAKITTGVPFATWVDDGDAVTCPACGERIEERKNATVPARYAKHYTETHSPSAAELKARLGRTARAASCAHLGAFCVYPGEIVHVAGRLTESTGWVYCPRCQTVIGEL